MNSRMARWQTGVTALAVLLVLAARSVVVSRTSSAPRDPGVFKLTSARVLGDGRIVRLQWEAGVSVGQAACNRLASTGVPDYQAGVNARLKLAVTYGGTTQYGECISTVSRDYNRPQVWTGGFNDPGFTNPGTGSLPTGWYVFQVVLTDAGGVDRFVHLWQGGMPSSEDLNLIGVPNPYPNSKVKLNWREPIPAGWTAKIYGTYLAGGGNSYSGLTTDQHVYDQQLWFTIDRSQCDAADVNTPAYTAFTIDRIPTAGATISFNSTVWVQEYLLPNPVPFGAPVTITSPANLIADEKGNATGAVTANTGAIYDIKTPSKTTLSVINDSLVGTDNWMAIPDNPNTPAGTLTFAKTLHISYSHGNDADATANLGTLGTNIDHPFKTAKAAFETYTSAQTNINIRFLRGDSWPATDQWTVSYWGTSRATPFLVDSYWNPAYGADPALSSDPVVLANARPLINLTNVYWDRATNTRAFFNPALFAQGTKGNYTGMPDILHRGYSYVRGLKLLNDIAFGYTGPAWPTGTYSDNQVLSDCEFYGYCNNQEMEPASHFYGLPVTGSMVHRTSISHQYGSQFACAAGQANDGATWSGGTTFYFPQRLANPLIAPQSNIAAGSTNLPIWGSAPPWNIPGWSVTVENNDGSNSETRVIGPLTNGSPAGGNGSVWRYPVTVPWTNAHNTAWAYSSATPDVSGYPCKVTLVPNAGTQFKIVLGTGRGSTVYTISGYDPATRAATVSPSMPTLDATSRILWQPENETGGGSQGIGTSNTSDFLFSQSVADHIGWKRPDDDPKWNDVLSHGIYDNYGGRDWCVWGSWFTDNCANGMMQRGGHTTAYCIIANNGDAFNHHSDCSMAYRNVCEKNGLYQYAASVGYDDITNHIIFDGNIMLTPTNLDANRTTTTQWPSSGNDFGISIPRGARGAFETNVLCGSAAHRIRNNTFVDMAALWISGRAPVPGTLSFRRNLTVNRPGHTAPNGDPFLAMYIQLTPGWGNNGPAGTVAETRAWEDFDQNAYVLSSNAGNFRWDSSQTQSLAKWKASNPATRDPNSIAPSTVTFSNGDFTLDTWASVKGVGSTYADVRNALTTRPTGVWPDVCDAVKCYQAYQAAYTPDTKNVPAIDGTALGYYGASDNRPARTSTRRATP